MIFHKNKARMMRGFTLTEAAIVLGIVGLILGAIWVAASSVYSNMRVSTAQKQLLAIVQSTRSMYATSATTGDADKFDETANFIRAGIFPLDMVNGAIVQNPWNVGGAANSVTVRTSTISSIGDSFTVSFLNMPQDACIKMLVSTAGNGADPGLVGVGKVGDGTKGATAVPVTAGVATGTICTVAGNTNIVDFTFKLKG